MAAPSAREFTRLLSDRVAAGERVVVATVISVEGSTSARPGAKALFDQQGRLVYGWVGGGCAESSVRDAALECLADRQPRVIRLDLDDEVLGVGMPCGGYMNIYVEPMTPEPKLLVLGHGTIAETVAQFGYLLEFHVTVNDSLATEQAFPNAHVRITEDPDYAKVEADGETFVVITTQHKSDYEALERVLRQGPAYVGLVASPKRSALLFERLHEDGFEAESLRSVSAPAGLDVGSRTPQEIALSIFSEIVTRYRGNKATGRPLVEIKGVKLGAEGIEAPSSSTSDGENCPR